jgi:hypothetical protein
VLPGSPKRAPVKRDAPFLEPSFHYLSQFPVNGPPPQVPQWESNGERHPSTEPSASHLLKIHLSPRVPGKGSPSMFPNRIRMERDTPSPGPLVYPFLSAKVPIKGALQNGDKHKVIVQGAPCKQKTYIQWGAAWFPRGSLMTFLSVPQCYMALGMVPSTLAWVDQSPVSQCVIAIPNRVHSPRLLPPPT